MIKRLSLLFACMLVFSCAKEAGQDSPYAVAHRGCWLSLKALGATDIRSLKVDLYAI